MITLPKAREQVFKQNATRPEVKIMFKSGRKEIIAETFREADQYLINKKKGLNHGK